MEIQSDDWDRKGKTRREVDHETKINSNGKKMLQRLNHEMALILELRDDHDNYGHVILYLLTLMIKREDALLIDSIRLAVDGR